MIQVDAHDQVWRGARGNDAGPTPDLPIRRDCTRDDPCGTVDQRIGCLGPSRLTLGSDWPVAKLAGGAVRRRASSRRLPADLDAPARDASLNAVAGMFHDLGEAT